MSRYPGMSNCEHRIERTLPGGVAAIDILDANGNVVVSAASGAAGAIGCIIRRRRACSVRAS